MRVLEGSEEDKTPVALQSIETFDLKNCLEPSIKEEKPLNSEEDDLPGAVKLDLRANWDCRKGRGHSLGLLKRSREKRMETVQE